MHFIEHFIILALLTVQYSFQEFSSSQSSSSSSSSSEESQLKVSLPKGPTIYRSFYIPAPISTRTKFINDLKDRMKEEKERDDKLVEEAREALDNYRFVIDENRINNEENENNGSSSEDSYTQNLIMSFRLKMLRMLQNAGDVKITDHPKWGRRQATFYPILHLHSKSFFMLLLYTFSIYIFRSFYAYIEICFVYTFLPRFVYAK